MKSPPWGVATVLQLNYKMLEEKTDRREKCKRKIVYKLPETDRKSPPISMTVPFY